MTQDIPKIYDPKEIEQKWYKIWEENKLFTPEENSEKESFTIVIPPPNVTGNLHMGHALDNSIQDVLIRYKRMQGFNALWVPGTDHAGIATQNVVAKALKAEGLTKEALGREKFLARVWEWKEQYGRNITRQLRRLGCALDWSRERFTMDEGLSKAVAHEFVTLYNEGYIYRGKRLVNWCPKCGTAISDIEVEYEAKKGKLWWLKYPLETIAEKPKSREAESRDYIIVATTRPETMLGDTAVAINPKDARYKKLIGQMLVLPLVNRRIPIIADDLVDPEFGSGAVKVTPAHDPNDFEMGERHDLPRINILTKDARVTLADFGDQEIKGIKEIEGLDRYKARDKIVEMLEQGGFLEKVEDYENNVGECYRCKTVIEPYLSDQWYVKVKDLAREAIKVVEQGKIKFVPDRWTKVYINWMANLIDWCISRQLWWGHRIPAWYCSGQSTVDPDVGIGASSGECHEIIVSEKKPEKCPKCGGTNLEQDPDVFDTWFSSALWPFSTLGWPEQTDDLKKFYPTDVLVTGYDIITFWVSKMIMSGVHFMKKEPFHTVFIHGLVRDAQGKKMSKSAGNVTDPIEVIDQIGADALRFALISLITGQGQDIKLTKDKITEARNFTNKIWNVTRFIMLQEVTGGYRKLQEVTELELADKWIVSRCQRLVEDVTRLLEEYDFGEAARKIYDFLWGEFCDWYVEISKADLYSDDPKRKERVLGVLLYVLEGSLRIMHPIMPFISEEIWDRVKGLGSRVIGDKFLLNLAWPKVEAKLVDEKAEEAMKLLMETITKVRNIKAEMGVQTKDIEVIMEIREMKEREMVAQGEGFLKSLAKISNITVHESLKTKPKQSATGVVGDIQFFIPLQGLIDIEKEVERLKKEQGLVDGEMGRLKALLANKNFVDKADPAAVEKQRERLKELSEKQKVLTARLEDLG